MTARKRFYREVSVEPLPEGEGRGRAYAVLLDGNPTRTPAGAPFLLPAAALAEAVAGEWRAQDAQIRPETMILTKLANTAIDKVGPNRRMAIEQILGFGKSDLLCYRAEAPEALVRRQAAAWDPLVEWARERYGVALSCGAGIGFIDQSPETLAALERAIAGHDDFTLAALQAAATLLGSAILALALWEGRLTPDQAFAAAQLDEIYQAEKWGSDHESALRSRKKAAELADIARFFSIARD